MTHRYADGTTDADRIRKKLLPSNAGPPTVVGTGPTRTATHVHHIGSHGDTGGARTSMPSGRDILSEYGNDKPGVRR